MERQLILPANPEFNEDDKEIVPVLVGAANEYINKTDPNREQFAPIVNGEMVAFMTVVLSHGRFTARELTDVALEAELIPEGANLTQSNVEQLLDVAEHILWDAGVNVTWGAELEGRMSRYTLETYAYEPTFQHVIATLGSDDELAADPEFIAKLYTDAFGGDLRDMYGGIATPAQSYNKMVERFASRKHVPQFVARAIIEKAVDAGLLTLIDTGTYIRVRNPQIEVEPKPRTPGTTFEGGRHYKDQKAAWAENPQRELALIAMRRLFWNSARKGVPLDGLRAWMQQDGVTDTHKEQVLAVLQANGAIKTVATNDGPAIALSDDLQAMPWSRAEIMVSGWFKSTVNNFEAYIV